MTKKGRKNSLPCFCIEVANNALVMQTMHPVLTDQGQTKRERDLESEQLLAFGASGVTNCCKL